MSKNKLTKNSPEKEYELFGGFLEKSRRVRFKEILKTKAGRQKWIQRLHHFNDLDPNMSYNVHREKQTYADLLEILIKQGAPKICSVMSPLSALDGQDVALTDVLSEIKGGDDYGSLICCIPSKLGLYYGEDRYRIILLSTTHFS